MVTYNPLMAFEFLRTPETLGTLIEKLSMIRASVQGARQMQRTKKKKDEKKRKQDEPVVQRERERERCKVIEHLQCFERLFSWEPMMRVKRDDK